MDTHGVDVDQRVGDDGVEVGRGGDGCGGGLEKIFAKLAPERVETQLGGGLAPRILHDVGWDEEDAFLFLIVANEGGFLFRCLCPGRIT